ncbi:DUF2069 domain-containing protein [Ectothiorhodospira marina]|uniref:Uncharacterized membrane protein n=1 Tax=Ectothiorhodospira marina TaxID=1396821 RepID=A0A1H7L6J9_9GAMM|nr:DUF2069 domain-containing protein [Ectothiorhodospira marina]SEK94464.1 Uncharacterized membrane protein [Ectothiorhodospira marina]
MRNYRILTLGGFFGLLALILIATTWASPPEDFPRSLLLLLLGGPLLLPLRGLLHGRTQAHIWGSLLALPYVVIGVAMATTGSHQAYGLLMLVLSLVFFAGCLGYVKTARGETRKP